MNNRKKFILSLADETAGIVVVFLLVLYGVVLLPTLMKQNAQIEVWALLITLLYLVLYGATRGIDLVRRAHEAKD